MSLDSGMSIPASTIRHEFQGFMQRLGTSTDENEPWYAKENSCYSFDAGIFDSVVPRTKQCSIAVQDLAGHKNQQADILIEGPDLKTPNYRRSVDVKYIRDGESLTRHVTVSDSEGVVEEFAKVGPGETKAHVELSGRGSYANGYANGYQSVADLLMPDEKDILREWNLTSLV